MSRDFWKDIDWFKPSEFDSPDKPGSGYANMDEQFIRRLNQLRSLLRRPLKVTSGYRTPDHNEKVSPATGRTGPHTTGKAVDLQVCAEDAFHVLELALALGFTGVGLNQKGPLMSRFIHLDLIAGNPDIPRPRVWTY